MTASKKIDLFKGAPGPALLPTDLLKRAASASLSQDNIGRERGPLDYGSDAGYEPLRDNVAKWLSDFYQPSHRLTSDRICISGGASQNMACVLQVFTDLGVTKNVWLVQPTYFLAVRMFEDAGYHDRLRPVPENESGIDLDYFAKALAESDADERTSKPTKPKRPYSKIYKHVLYCVPTFSNPSGTTMPLETRQELVRIARKHDVLVICDDVYDFLRWPSDSSAASSNDWRSEMPRLIDVDASLDGGPPDKFGNVVSNGSFSKIVAPGVRVGWAEGTASFAYGLSQAGSSRSGGAPSQMTSTFINEMIENGSLTRHISQHLVPAYARRHRIAIQGVKKYLEPHGARIETPSTLPFAGGYFVWIALPSQLQATDVTTIAAQKQNLVVPPGPSFAVAGDEEGRRLLERYLRICYAWEGEDYIHEGLVRLGLAIDEAIAKR